MLVICGGYEGVLLGLDTDTGHSGDPNFEADQSHRKESGDRQEGRQSVTQSFRILCSQGSIKCMSLFKNVLVCGGSDETVQVYNVEKRRKHGEIMLPEGLITAVAAFGGLSKGFVLVGNEHGDISLFMTKDLSFDKAFKGHKKEVTGLAVHSEGKTFISTSTDHTLRLWDLTSKTCVFNTKLSFSPTSAHWSTGARFSSAAAKTTPSTRWERRAIAVGGHANSVTSCCWLGDHVVLGFKSGTLAVYKGARPHSSDKRVATAKEHPKRVKAVTAKQGHVFSGDSDGNVLGWKFEGGRLELLWYLGITRRRHEIGFRLNVMTA